MMNRFVLVSHVVLAGLPPLHAFSASQSPELAEFTQSELPTGWTVQNEEYVSPEYDSAVDRVEILCSGADVSATAEVRGFTRQGEGAPVATFTAATSGAAFDFPDATDFRSFRVKTSDGMTLTSFAAYVSPAMLDAPSGVAVSNNTTGVSFDAAWNAVDGATGYRVYVWTNVVAGAAEGTEVWADDFSKADAGSTSAKAIDSTKFNESYSDTSQWECNGYIYPYTASGAVRLGASDKAKTGVLRSPHLPGGDDYYLRMRAWRYSAEDGTDMPVMRNSSGVTSLVQVVTFTKEPGVPEEFMIKLPAMTEGDHLVFHSFTNKSPRVILDRVAVVSGYSEGSLEPSYIVDGFDVGAGQSHSFAALPSVPVQFAVEAYGRRGVSSEKTEAVEVDLANPDKVAMLNACPLSSLEEGTYTQDFDSLAGADANWLNGATLQYWQAYRGDDAVTKITHNTGTGSSGGLYALAENTKSDVRAFGGITTKTDLLTWGIAFTNDTDRPVVLSSVGYSAQQWGTRNDEAHNLTMSYLLTGSLKWMVDETGDWTECCSTAADGNKPAVPVLSDAAWNPEEPVAIAPGQILFLKWNVDPPANGSAAMMGIDNVTVTFKSAPVKGFFIHLADI